MKGSMIVGAAALLAAASTATANPLLQLDLNGFTATASGSFGLNFTGSVTLTRGSGILNDILILPTGFAGPSNSQGAPIGLNNTNGLTGVINFSNGQVTGGNINVRLSNNDTYTTQISSGGSVGSFVGGGFTVQALTFGGLFNDNVFGALNIAQWFNNQGGGGLPGSFLQFRFNPNSQGSGTADMDLFVNAVPLPPAAWAGLATLAGVVVARRVVRR